MNDLGESAQASEADGPSTEKQEGPTSVRTTDLQVLIQRVLEKASRKCIQMPTVTGGMLLSRQAVHERRGHMPLRNACESLMPKSILVSMRGGTETSKLL